MIGHLTRRRFNASLASLAAACASHRVMRAQTTSAHLDVAIMERTRVLAAATSALTKPILTITSIASPIASPHEFYSELPADPDPTRTTKPHTAFRDHAIALREASSAVATLTAAYLLTHEDRYALRAGRHLAAWFVDPATSVSPQFSHAAYDQAKQASAPAAVVDLVPLAEIARALCFLPDTDALTPPELTAVKAWFTDCQGFLNTDRSAFIAREAKDHTASAWLLIASAIARSLADDKNLDACRHRFRRPTLRNQIDSLGVFPHEITTAFPYRNTLFNFDLLATACQILSTRFDNLWLYELEDGPGMRSVAAFLYPTIRDRAIWPQVADPQSFRDLPGRRAALLFAGRAFDRPEYVALWRATPAPDPAQLPEPIAASFPISQPLLWTARAPHGL